MSPAYRPVEWLVGVDIGQTRDPTAVAVLQRVPLVKRVKDADGRAVPVLRDDHVDGARIRRFQYQDHFHLRQLERLKLGSPYQAIVDRTAEILSKLPPYSSVAVVDQTGVGRPVVEQMAHLPIVPVTITSGQSFHADHDGWKVAKKVLVSNAQVLLQNGRLKVAGKIKIVRDFVAEMAAFRVKLSAASQTFESHREGVHDDLVLAVCLALWWGSQRQTGWLPNPPFPDLDDDGAPHPRAGQPQDLVVDEDAEFAAARKRFARG